MGGPGSGRWYRWKSTKTTLDEVHRLDVRWLQRHGYLQRWAQGVLTWSRGEHETGAVGVALEDGRLVVTYRVKVRGGAWEPVRQVLDLTWTPCHYGGQRPWFLCPGCQRRAAVLCLDGKWFLCRHCYALPYGSQQETAADRSLRKVRKLREKLGASMNLLEPIWTKPKGMHWRTFARLVQEEEAAQRAQLVLMHATLERLETWGTSLNRRRSSG